MKTKNCLITWKKKHGSRLAEEEELVVDKSLQEAYTDEIITNLVDKDDEKNITTEGECKVPSCGMVLNVNATGAGLKNITTDLAELVLSKKVSLNEIDMSTVSKYCADKFKYILSDNSVIPQIIDKLFSAEIKAGDEKLLSLEDEPADEIETLKLVNISSPHYSDTDSKQPSDRILPLSDESRISATASSCPQSPKTAKDGATVVPIDEEKQVIVKDKEVVVKELPTLKTGIWFFDNINTYLDMWNDVVTGMNKNNLFKLLNLSALLRYFGDPAGNILLEKVCKSNLLPSDEPQKKSWKNILDREDDDPIPMEMVPLPTFSNKSRHDRCAVTTRKNTNVNADHYFKLYWDSTEKWMMSSFGPNMTAISKLYLSTKQWFMQLTKPAQIMFIRLSNVFCTIPSSPRALTFD